MARSPQEASLHALIDTQGLPSTIRRLGMLVDEVGRLGLTPTARDLDRFTPGCASDIWGMTYRCAFLVEAALLDKRSRIPLPFADLVAEGFTSLAESLKSTHARTYTSIMGVLGDHFYTISYPLPMSDLGDLEPQAPPEPESDVAFAMHVIQAASPSHLDFHAYEVSQNSESEKKIRHRERRKLAKRVLPVLENSVISPAGWQTIMQATGHLIS